MKTRVLCSVLAAALLNTASATYITAAAMLPRQAASSTSSLAPSTTNTPDSWRCATANISQYFDPPKPTGTLLTALGSFGDSLIAPCTKTATGTQLLSCTVSDPAAWCPYSTKAPASVSALYGSYARGAASWWAARSSSAIQLQADCPVTWQGFRGSDQYWFNLTVAHASCYLKANPIVSSSSSASGVVTTSAGTGTSKPLTTTTTSTGAAVTTTSSRAAVTSSSATSSKAATTAK